MDDFQKRIEQDLLNFRATFNNDSRYEKIRELYKNNFPQIVEFINKFGSKGAIEDISKLDISLFTLINSEIILLKEINRGTKEGKIEVTDIV